MLGNLEAVFTIHGGVNRDDRRKAQEKFRNNPDAPVLVATDAAGEGVNLQNAAGKQPRMQPEKGRRRVDELTERLNQRKREL